MDDLATTATASEEQVSTLSGISVDLTVEDLQKCTKAYKEDKGHVVAYTNLRQGQKYEDFYMIPFGLMVRVVMVNKKLSFLSLCGKKS